MFVRVKNYNEIKDAGWMVEEMSIYCGKTYEVLCEVDERFVMLDGCGDWQFAKDGVEVLDI